MSVEPRITQLIAALQGLTEELDPQILAKEEELKALRTVSNRAANAIRALDPPAPKPSKKKEPELPPVPEESLLRTLGWLQTRAEAINGNGGIWVAKLYDDPDFNVFNSATDIRNAVNVLHDRGYITLDRVAQGGRRIYKVVTE
jgi:hypothetical protein